MEAPTPPFRIVDLELTEPLPDLKAADASGKRYNGAWCLLRWRGVPIGTHEVSWNEDGIEAVALAALLSRHTRQGERSGTKRARPQSEPFISTIVATRDRTESLSRCLDSVLRQNNSNFE